MKNVPKYFLWMPALGLVVLCGAAVEMAYRPRPGDAAPYHQHVHDAAYANGGIPETIGPWNWNRDYKQSETAANELLKPNVLIQRQYQNSESGRTVFFLLDQCPDARAMLGHYPPVCYKEIGLELTGRRNMSLAMHGRDGADMPIEAMEYIFTDRTQGSRRMVINFFILPSGHFATDMDEVDKAAADFVRRYYGVAQMQFVFDLPRNINEAELAELRTENQKTVETFLSAVSDLLKVIYSGGRS